MSYTLRGISYKCLTGKLRGRLIGFKERVFKEGKLAVICNSEDACINFAEWCLSNNIIKIGNTNIQPNVYDMSWTTYGSKTAYIVDNTDNIKLYYACLDYFVLKGYKVCIWKGGV